MKHTERLIERAQELIDNRVTGYNFEGEYGYWAGTPTTKSKAFLEYVVDHKLSGVSVIIRTYEDGTQRVTFETGFGRISRKEAEARIADAIEAKRQEEREAEEAAIKAALEPSELDADEALRKFQQEHNLGALIRNGLTRCSFMTYPEWDLLRRELYKQHEGDAAIDGIEVDHHEHESVLYIGGSGHDIGGRVVAEWSQATGQCHITAPQRAAEQLAEGLANMIKNSLQHGWGE